MKFITTTNDDGDDDDLINNNEKNCKHTSGKKWVGLGRDMWYSRLVDTFNHVFGRSHVVSNTEIAI